MDQLIAADRWLFHLVYDAGGEPLRWGWVVTTHLGSRGGVWLLVGLGLAFFGRGALRRTGLAVATALASTVALNELGLKQLFSRPRPWKTLGVPLHDGLVNPQGMSFPSGHSVAAFACAVVLAARWPAWRWPLLALAAAIAVSRVVLGAHYPADVVAGSLVGSLLGVALGRIWMVKGRSAELALVERPEAPRVGSKRENRESA